MQAVIQAGGKGTRLSALTKNEIPKPMVEIAGKPLLLRQIETLKDNGITDIIIIIGHLGGVIKSYFGNGEAFGACIRYIEETAALGSAGALFYARELLDGDDFLLVFGDVMFDIDVGRMLRFHREKKSLATLFVHPNSHPFDSDLVVMDENGRVTCVDPKNNARIDWYDNLVNAGLYILNNDICGEIKTPVKTDLEKDILFKLIEKSMPVYGYRSTEYIRDAGTPKRLADVERAVQSGLVKTRNLRYGQKCIFLDRDGTLTKFNGLIYREEQLELEKSAAEAVRLINESGYLAIAATNQPVVARGLCGVEDVKQIHKKLSTLLGDKGAYLDDIVFCPHHPDKGYPEENPAYKIDCGCRKPKTGMLEEMANRYNIDLSSSWIIGDTTMDIQTGINAGMRTALVETGEAGKDAKFDVKFDLVCADINSAVRGILDFKG